MEWFQWITTLCPAGLTHLPLTRQAFSSTPTWWNFGTLLQTVFVKHTTNPGFKGLIEGYCAMLLHKNIPNICAEPLDIKRSIWIKQDLRGRPHMNTSKSTQWDGGMATGQDTKRKEEKRKRRQMYARWLWAIAPAALDGKALEPSQNTLDYHSLTPP